MNESSLWGPGDSQRHNQDIHFVMMHSPRPMLVLHLLLLTHLLLGSALLLTSSLPFLVHTFLFLLTLLSFFLFFKIAFSSSRFCSSAFILCSQFGCLAVHAASPKCFSFFFFLNAIASSRFLSNCTSIFIRFVSCAVSVSGSFLLDILFMYW